MPYAVTLCLDSGAAAQIERLRRALVTHGFTAVTPVDHAPHITLAVLCDNACANQEAIDAAVDLAASESSFPVTLSGLGLFPGDAPVVWAVPVVTRRMIECPGALHSLFDHAAVDPHTLPGAWVPHVTPGQPGRRDVMPVLDCLLAAWRGPILGEADRVEVVRFPPVRVPRTATLAPAPPYSTPPMSL